MAVREEHNNADKWLAVVFSSCKDWEFILKNLMFFNSSEYEEIFECGTLMLTFQCSTPSSNICLLTYSGTWPCIL